MKKPSFHYAAALLVASLVGCGDPDETPRPPPLPPEDATVGDVFATGDRGFVGGDDDASTSSDGPSNVGRDATSQTDGAGPEDIGAFNDLGASRDNGAGNADSGVVGPADTGDPGFDLGIVVVDTGFPVGPADLGPTGPADLGPTGPADLGPTGPADNGF
jgi:hypothetical protein